MDVPVQVGEGFLVEVGQGFGRCRRQQRVLQRLSVGVKGAIEKDTLNKRGGAPQLSGPALGNGFRRAQYAFQSFDVQGNLRSFRVFPVSQPRYKPLLELGVGDAQGILYSGGQGESAAYCPDHVGGRVSAVCLDQEPDRHVGFRVLQADTVFIGLGVPTVQAFQRGQRHQGAGVGRAPRFVGTVKDTQLRCVGTYAQQADLILVILGQAFG